MSADDATDTALMAAYARGDRRAFDSLFARLAPRLHGFFYRSFGDATTADDLLQVTFLKIHQGRHQFRSEFPIRVWAFSIAARVRIDELRRRYRLPQNAGDDELDRADAANSMHSTEGDRKIDDEELAASVRRAISELPDSQRVVIQLHRFEGMTFPEIGQVLGTTEGAVKLRAFRAYERLRTLLRGALEERASGT